MFKYNKSSGQVAKMLLAGVIVCLIAIIIAYFVIKSAEKPPKPDIVDITVPVALYETTQNDIKFTFQDAQNMGSTLYGSKSENPSYTNNITITENFIKVTIGAQNKGKENTPSNSWEMGNIIDSDGRIFIASTYSVSNWLPKDNLCGDILKPEFAPLPCTKIFEVAKISKGLKIEVLANKKDANGKYDSGEKDTFLLDLIVNP